jgi:hypothetical protein
MPCSQLREPTLNLTMLVAERPEAFSPWIAAKASLKSPVEIPFAIQRRNQCVDALVSGA